MQDLASRMNNRIQLTADGMAAYPDAVERMVRPRVTSLHNQSRY
jgi:hypothetical protein